MRYHYLTVDVFTNQRFGGNQLAVIPDARGLTAEQMQTITQEFNFAESTFVLPPASPENDAQVRIFTPGREVPFAGHPNVGTAFVLASLGQVHGRPVGEALRFEEKAGLVLLTVTRNAAGHPVSTELTAPAALALGDEVPAMHVAAAAGLELHHISQANHRPQTASVGLPFTLAELHSVEALAAAKPDLAAFDQYFTGLAGDALYLYVRTGGGIQARMFAPLHGVIEDSATGSAAAALTGYLAHLNAASSGAFPVSIAQGLEIGRPSRIDGTAEKVDGQVTAVRVGGPCVAVMEGFLQV
jgi:trans-2,3-dihydro-3-hydroxyanthranilate isomerase